jgi:hypothetical protein
VSIEAMKQALEALEMLARYENPETRIQVRKPKDGGQIVTMYPHKVATDAAAVLRTAIAEAEKQELFGYFQYAPHFDAWVQNRDSNEGVAFYTAPPAAPRQWVGLTEEEIDSIDLPPSGTATVRDFIRLIEAKLKEKNHG